MSRGQQQTVIDTASGENKTYNQNAQTSFDTTQKDIGDYASAVGGFKAANPYTQGGQAQTVENQQLSDTAAGLAESAGQGIQAAGVRTGQNTGGAIAATKEMQAENMRALAGEEAGATERRLGAGAGYGQAVLGAEEKIPGMEDAVAEQQGKLAEGALQTDAQASATPGFGDVLGDAFGSALGKTLGGGNLSLTKAL